MAQQTAMQKLFTNLESIGITIPKGVEMVFLKIEKEQIINAFDIACEDEDRIGEEYYNDTYGGQGSPDTSPNTQNK